MDSASLNHAMIDDQEAQAAQAAADAFGQTGHESIEPMLISQRYDGYTQDNQEAWRQLYAEQMAYLPERASQVYLDGAEAIGLKPDGIPNIKQLNARLDRTSAGSPQRPGPRAEAHVRTHRGRCPARAGNPNAPKDESQWWWEIFARPSTRKTLWRGCNQERGRRSSRCVAQAARSVA